ncbi:SPOR domain-containing protein [Marinimicrobium locisalis]|uniref:SPOR domain-containing protein n=1 Tax=Marinimicrobium locisalis TaxID=546022 RepID=UPI0032215D4A
MRAIFVVLVIANLLLLSLQWVSPSETAETEQGRASSSPEAPSLRLLSEAEEGALTGAAQAQQKRDSSRSRPAEEARPLCEWVGPFANAAQADSLQQRLQALDVSADQRSLEISDGRGYWVHLPPELSQRAALQKLHELQAKEIDSYVIPRGELENGISFGMFSRQSLAAARRDELVDMGYDAQIHEIERTHREIWLAMPVREAGALSDTLWEELLATTPELERRQNFCSGVASE